MLSGKTWRTKHVAIINIIINLNYEFLPVIIIDFLRGSETRRQESPKVNNGSSATFDTTRACTGF